MTERAQSYKTALTAGASFGLVFGLFTLVQTGRFPPATLSDAVSLLTAIAASGGVFGFLTALFLRSPVIPRPADLALEPGERIEHTGLANHFLNLEGRGGRLALTNTHLIFKPHAVNLQRRSLRIPRGEIVSAAAVRIFGLVPRGLAVNLKNGKTEKFVVDDRTTWLSKLART